MIEMTSKQKSLQMHQEAFCLVRMEGLEPPHLTASDPKSDVSTNFTTSGLRSSRSLRGSKSLPSFSRWPERFEPLKLLKLLNGLQMYGIRVKREPGFS